MKYWCCCWIVVILLFCLFVYINEKKERLFKENFNTVDDIVCNKDTIVFYADEYINKQNVLYETHYKKCSDYTSTVDTLDVSPTNQHIILTDINNMLTSLNETLENTKASEINRRSLSNQYNNELSASNATLFSNSNTHFNRIEDLNDINDLYGSMDYIQTQVNALSNLDGLILNDLCSEILNNEGDYKTTCSLISQEDFSRDKLESMINTYVLHIPKLSTAYILALKTWITYNQVSSILEINQDQATIRDLLNNAIDKYNSTMEAFKSTEESMFKTMKVYQKFKSNFYHTNSNDTNREQRKAISISQASLVDYVGVTVFSINNDTDGYAYNPLISDAYRFMEEYLFSSCDLSINIDGEGNHFIRPGDSLICKNISIPNREEARADNIEDNTDFQVVERNIDGCSGSPTDEACVEKQQSKFIKSGIEYIFRRSFPRNVVKDVSLEQMTMKKDVDKNLMNVFLKKMFDQSSS